MQSHARLWAVTRCSRLVKSARHKAATTPCDPTGVWTQTDTLHRRYIIPSSEGAVGTSWVTQVPAQLSSSTISTRVGGCGRQWMIAAAAPRAVRAAAGSVVTGCAHTADTVAGEPQHGCKSGAATCSPARAQPLPVCGELSSEPTAKRRRLEATSDSDGTAGSASGSATASAGSASGVLGETAASVVAALPPASAHLRVEDTLGGEAPLADAASGSGTESTMGIVGSAVASLAGGASGLVQRASLGPCKMVRGGARPAGRGNTAAQPRSGIVTACGVSAHRYGQPQLTSPLPRTHTLSPTPPH
jgi:hypothetical protein